MKKHLYSSLLILLLLSACSNEDYDKAMEQGVQNLGNEEYHQAAVYFERAKQEQDDQEAAAYYQQASAMDEALESYKQKDFEQALTSLKKVMDVNQGLETVQKDAEKMKKKIQTEMELTASFENNIIELEQDIEEGNEDNAEETYEKLKSKLKQHPSLESYQPQLNQLHKELENLLKDKKESQTAKESEQTTAESDETSKKSVSESAPEDDKDPNQETSTDQEDETEKPEKSDEENNEAESSNEEETKKNQDKEPEMTYTSYSNERFGFSFEYPDFLTMAPPPTNGDGVELYSNDGFELTAYGTHTMDPSKDIDDYYNQATAEIQNIAYQKKTDDWFVLSYKSNDIVTYSKFYLGESQLNSLTITYPDSQKEKYDPITARISKSFSANPK
ncbi:hypothetical protein [Halobacillus sp. B29]|uniref:hypothetical protein n=1 Tax=Halobacillus sp. B29 TaxID=3457432 RepID=UPI003FCE49E0